MWPPDFSDSRDDLLQDTRKPLTDWFRAMYWVTTQQKNGSQVRWVCSGCSN